MQITALIYAVGIIAYELNLVANGRYPSFKGFAWPLMAMKSVAHYIGALIIVLKAGKSDVASE